MTSFYCINAVFIWQVLHFSRQFYCVYAFLKGSTSMFYFIDFMSYIVMIHLFAISFIYLVIYRYVFYFYLIGSFELRFWVSFFHFHDSNYDFISEIEIIIIKYFLIVSYSQRSIPGEYCFSQRNGAISQPLLFIYFSSFYLASIHGWIRPLFFITDFIGSTFLKQ